MNSEHIHIDTGGELAADDLMAAVLRLLGDPATGPTESPDSVFFGFRDSAAAIGPWPWDDAEVSIILERAGASQLGAKDDAAALFELLAAHTGWRLELYYHDHVDGPPNRTRPRLTGRTGSGFADHLPEE